MQVSTENQRPAGAIARTFLVTRLPEFGGIAWLLLLAVAIWSHTHASTQPPVYDALSYYQKAWNFWAAVHKLQPFNPLNLEPTFRPPGTVLMSFPFGFSIDPRGFYFRSIYFPAAILFLAVLVTAYNIHDDLMARVRIMLTAAFFGTLTLIYQFEIGAGSYAYWGLVDGFLAAVAALAAAATWRGTRAKSAAWAWSWSIVAAFASGLGMLVKPSGALVAAIAGIAWVVFAVTRLVGAWSRRTERPHLMLRLLAGAVLIGATDCAVMLAAVSSRYLSHGNMQLGLDNIAIMKSELRLPIDQLWPLVNTEFGDVLVVWIVLSIMLIAFRRHSDVAEIKRNRSVAPRVATVVAWCTLLFGIWFWLVGSGGLTQIRYAVPFFMMALVWLLPGVVGSWPSVPAVRHATVALMAAALLNLMLLLLVPTPSAIWQRFSGVGLTSNFPASVMQAYRRLTELPRTAPITIYAFRVGENDAVLNTLATQTDMLHPEMPPIWLKRPIDWVRSSTFRIKEIAAADYLLISPGRAQPPTAGPINDLSAETRLFTAWADELTPADGVAVFFASDFSRILRIADRRTFRASLDRFVSSHRWDAAFDAANRVGTN